MTDLLESLIQSGIAEPVPTASTYLFFSIAQPAGLTAALSRIKQLVDGRQLVLGVGPSLVEALDRSVPGLHELPDFSRADLRLPSTPTAIWCWLRGSERGELLTRARSVIQALAPALQLAHGVEAFRHGEGRDLTGYEDGTENPTGDDALSAAFVAGTEPGLTGSSMVAVQQWQHDFDAFDAMSVGQQDDMVGRRRSDNEELDDAPTSAHVKRTAQEDFEPPAFVMRRSMPWTAGGRDGGLMFVAFGHSLRAFEAQMRRMAGHDDGVTDALFKMSRPVSSASFWCPPMNSQRLYLRLLGLP